MRELGNLTVELSSCSGECQLQLERELEIETMEGLKKCIKYQPAPMEKRAPNLTVRIDEK